MLNKRGLSPLIATLLLVVFALVVGTATMSWGKSYVETIPDETETVGSSYVISREDVKNNPLKRLQIDYIYDEISLEEYLKREKEIIS